MKRLLILLGIFTITFAIALPFLPSEIPLFNTNAVREDRLASKYVLIIIPVCVGFLYGVYLLILKRLALENSAMLRLIEGFILFLSAVSYLGILRIIITVI